VSIASLRSSIWIEVNGASFPTPQSGERETTFQRSETGFPLDAGASSGLKVEIRMPLTIRSLTSADRAAWEPLWQGYLTFYKASLPAEVTETTWQRLLDPAEPMFVWGAFEGDTLLGIVQCVLHRTTWSQKRICYLQDLFTVPAARGKGVGRALIEHVYGVAKAENWFRVYWQTHEANAEAQVLYNKVADRSGFIVYRKNM
jgi:GNAT superfamily N-acetyltransferase